MLGKIIVMITGIGAPGAPGIIKSLRIVKERNIRIVGVDANITTSVGVGMVDIAYQVPMADDPEFVDQILNICKKEKVDVIIPLVTKELFAFSRNKNLFLQDGITVQVSDYSSICIANNKYKLMKFCKNNGIPTPEFFLVNSLEEFKDKAELLGYPFKNICFKPPISNGMRGFRIIEEDTNKLQKLLNEKPNSVYIGYEEFIQMCNDANFFPELLLMEYLPGDEYSVDILVDDGVCLSVIPRSRDYIKMGISFVGTVIKDDEIIGYSKELVEKLGLNGNIGLQFKRNINGIPKIIESNPRVQGTIVLCTASGYNMVYNSVKCALGEKIPKLDISWNTRMIRYWEELYMKDNGETFKL